jgi:hypothetical protein
MGMLNIVYVVLHDSHLSTQSLDGGLCIAKLLRQGEDLCGLEQLLCMLIIP